MTLLNHAALERARRNAGLLPTDLARRLHSSVDTVTAIIERGSEDHKFTLADLRRVAVALAVAPRDLLHDERTSEPREQLDVRLAALMHRDGTTSIDELAARLRCTNDDVLAAVDAYNNGPAHGLKIMGWHDELGLVPDPAIEIPERPAAFNAPEAAHIDHLLWTVIDRQLPATPAEKTTGRLQAMADAGLVTRLDGEWRPTDHVIVALDLLDWDTLDVVAAARQPPGETHSAA